MPLSDFDRYNVHAIMAGHGNWFTAQFLRFLRDARPDDQTWERLRSVFPEEVAAVEWWVTHRADEAPFTYEPKEV